MSQSIQNSTKSSKRQDLQGIRGIAIISVLGFHFLPNIFPNGYIGVDQFFVLSGFLMCMLLQKSSSTSSSIFKFISNFYIRRLKRILPLYFLIVLLSIIAIFTIFPLTAINTNVASGKKALVFMSNRAGTDTENYFSMLSLAIDVFTHTWSLSVEVQFYLLVPFLYLVGAKMFRREFEIPFYIGLGTLSYIYSTFFCTPINAFNSVPARIWQFTVGMLAYLISDSNSSSQSTHSNKVYQKLDQVELLAQEEEQREEPLQEIHISTTKSYITHFLIISINFGLFFPLAVPSEILRPLITILTGVLMIYPPESQNSILESRFIVYFGDISYSLYLIHWPVYAYWKLNMSDGDTWNAGLIVAFEVAVVLAVLSYELYEKWYLKQSNKSILIICTMLLLLNIGAFYGNDIRTLISPPLKMSNRLDGLNESGVASYEQAEQLNQDWSVHDVENLKIPSCEYEEPNTMWGMCRHKNITKKESNIKIMIIGNSWAANHGRLVYEECRNQASSIVQLSVSGCEPLYNNHTDHGECDPSIARFEEKLKYEMPDYLFIFSRFINIGDPMQPNITNLDDDIIFQKMKSQAERYSNLVTKKIFLMQQIPRLHIPMLADIVKSLKENKDLVKFDKSLIDMDPQMARLRYEKLASECKKCELFDYKPLFYNEKTGKWRFYDEDNYGLTYITQGLHLSYHGLELIRPVITGVCSKIGNE